MLVQSEMRQDVLVLRLSNPPANILSMGKGMADEVAAVIERAERTQGCRGVVIAGDGAMFCGGADLNELDRVEVLRGLLARIEEAAVPVVMAIHGMALGGGLELALAGHSRIASPGAKLALPEVTLGLLPGLGGTQRLPRLIGRRAALDMMLSGKTISAEAALEVGLIDSLAEGDLVDWALTLLAERALPLRKTSALPCPADLDEAGMRVDAGLDSAQVQIIGCVAAMTDDFAQGMRHEAAAFDELAASDVSQRLRQAFFAKRAERNAAIAER